MEQPELAISFVLRQARAMLDAGMTWEQVLPIAQEIFQWGVQVDQYARSQCEPE